MMKRHEIKQVLDELTKDIDNLTDKKAVTIIKVLVNLVEMLAEENALLREENQVLRDEINRLKGEQGKPDIRGQSKGGNGDNTGSRVNGKNHYTHVLCNDFFTAYFTRRKKDRLTLLELLCRDQLEFMFNQEAYELMVEFGLAKKWLDQITPMLHSQPRQAMMF
jgi:regulator of replication initiation timing